MALLLLSEMEDAGKWRDAIESASPSIDFRVWPDAKNTSDITMVAMDYNYASAEYIKRFPRLQCIAFLGHGAGDLLSQPWLPANVKVMRLRDPGIIRTMIEYVVLYLLRDLRFEPIYCRQQREKVWLQHQPRFAPDVRVGVMGLGSVGESVARKLKSFDFLVDGWARTQHAIDGVRCHAGAASIEAFLSELDYIVCALPLTEATQEILNRETFGFMKTGAYLINVGRGGLVNEKDLLHALDTDRLSGATLDVFATEPLPATSPFWHHPKVMVTPHESGARVDGSIPDVIENYRRLGAGEALLNLADPTKGY